MSGTLICSRPHHLTPTVDSQLRCAASLVHCAHGDLGCPQLCNILSRSPCLETEETPELLGGAQVSKLLG